MEMHAEDAGGNQEEFEVLERKLFGTDGVRGVANEYPMTAEVALKLGRAICACQQSMGITGIGS